jgi:hypothetical protein
MTGAGFGRQFGAGASDAERRVEQWAAQVAEKAQRYQSMQAQVAGISVTEHSDDGAIQLTVGSSGVLTDLSLTDRAAQIPPRELAAQIMDTMRRAQGKLSSRVAEVMQASVGEDTETVSSVVSSYQQRFPQQPDEDEPPAGGHRMRIGDIEDDSAARRAPQPPPRTPRDDYDDDDDWELFRD